MPTANVGTPGNLPVNGDGPQWLAGGRYSACRNTAVEAPFTEQSYDRSELGTKGRQIAATLAPRRRLDGHPAQVVFDPPAEGGHALHPGLGTVAQVPFWPRVAVVPTPRPIRR